MNSAIRATIPLLTAPLVDICNPGALDGLHVALMSTLSAHLSPTWNASRPSFGAALRVLNIAPNAVVPKPLDKAAQQIRIKVVDWISLLLAHNKTRAMSISVDPGMVAVQLAEQSMPTVHWKEDLVPNNAANNNTRASSPISPLTTASSSSSTDSTHAPWNARKSRLPSLVPASARQASMGSSSSNKILVGSPRTPKSFNGFTFPPSTSTSASASGAAPQLSISPTDALFGSKGGNRRVEEEEPAWMANLLSTFPEVPAPGRHSRTPSQQQQQQPVSTSYIPLRANAPVYRPPQTPAALRRPGAGHVRSESTESWASSTRSSPTSSTQQQRLSPIGSPSSSTAAAAASAGGGIYNQLALNMSQLSLASSSTSSSCGAPSLSSVSSHSSASSQRAASPADELLPAADGFYHFDVSPPVPSGNTVYYDDGLPSPVSPTASAYAYVDHAARKSVTEYECGKVGVLGGAVMLGVPAGVKKQNRNSMPPLSTLPQRGPLPSIDFVAGQTQMRA